MIYHVMMRMGRRRRRVRAKHRSEVYAARLTNEGRFDGSHGDINAHIKRALRVLVGNEVNYKIFDAAIAA